MSVFVDTSAILAGLDQADQYHEAARATWTDLLQGNEPLLTTNYVIVETMALLQHRGGLAVVRRFLGEFFQALQVHGLIEAEHVAAVDRLLATDRRQIGLVDCTSVVMIRQLGCATTFAFDPDFAQQGFPVIPR